MKRGFLNSFFLVVVFAWSLSSNGSANVTEWCQCSCELSVAGVSSCVSEVRNIPSGQPVLDALARLVDYSLPNERELFRYFTSALGPIESAVLFLGFSARIANKLNRASGQTESPNGTNPALWWGIILVLLILSLYLLFQIKKKETMGEKTKVLESELAVLYNNAPCGYFSIGEGDFFLNINKTLLDWLGYTKEEIVSRLKLTDIVEGKEAEVKEKISTLNKLTDAYTTHLSLLKKNGDKIPVIIGLVKTDGINLDPARRLFSVIDHTECYHAVERIKNLDQELEALSYSISHDLRAPLRSIDGYSKILQEDYAGQLDEEGRRVLNIIMSNAKRMGKLIDDLLDFGRLGRKTIQATPVDMKGMVNSIVNELVAQEPNRRIDVKVGELYPATADADMVRQAWFNLLENAIKYTGKKDVAVIEVSSYKIDNSEICYEVKDNGVGFDMKYAHKLFGVFQRLHKMQDFSGTGVGLAIVKRIVSRHGGRIWADGSLQGGAIFYFTLPFENDKS